jgi:ABC-2 type transport system permease protein
VSLEGRSLWIVRTSPVPTRTVLRGKVAYHLLLTLPVALVSGILTSLALGKGLAVSLSLILLLLAHNLFLAVFGLFCNLLLPKLEWSNMMIPVKQGGSAALTLLAGMFLSLLFGGCGILLSLLLPPAIALALASLLPLGGAALLFLYLMRGGVRRFESL